MNAALQKFVRNFAVTHRWRSDAHSVNPIKNLPVIINEFCLMLFGDSFAFRFIGIANGDQFNVWQARVNSGVMLTTPSSVSPMARGCSKISFCM